MKNKNVTAEVNVSIPLLKTLKDSQFLLNVGALTLSLGKRNFILDSIETDYENEKKKGGVIKFSCAIAVDLDTFEVDKTYNYKLIEADLVNKKLKAEFFCGDEDAGVEGAFDFDNATIECVVTVNHIPYKIKKVTFE